MTKKAKIWIAVSVAAVLLLTFFIWFWLYGTFWSFSESYTEGYIQNFGCKGNWIKTWECEVAKRGSIQGNQGIWECSVSDDSVREKIQSIHSDQLVRIQYVKYWHVGSMTGKTPYIVKRVEVINPISPRIEQLLREFGSNYIDTEDMRNFLKSQREKWSSPLGH